MGANVPYLTASSGRRGYLRYQFGTHFWQPYKQVDFSRGFIRDMAKTDLPDNALYDSLDFLVHRPGHLVKRGATVYGGHALGGTATFSTGLIYAQFSAGDQLLAISDTGDNGGSASGHLYVVTAGAATDKGGVSGHSFKCVDTPKMFYGPAVEYVVFPQAEAGGAVPIIYDGTNAPTRLASSADGEYCAVYKGRIVVGGGNHGGAATLNRAYFSPLVDPTVAWDTTSFIDFDHPITGFAALQNALLVFSLGHTERLVGTSPPPNSDMDRQPVGDIGCIDARSIAVYQNNAVFANARGIYMTNGVGFRNLTAGPHGNDGIESYWQKTAMAGFTPSTDIVSGGIIRDFYFVTVSTTGITLMCHIPTGAWTRISNFNALMYATAASSSDELYYSDGVVPRVVKVSPIFLSEADITDSGKDANGTAVTPSAETKAFGTGISDVAWGDIHLNFAMNDTSPTSSPTMAVSYVPHAYSSEGAAVSAGSAIAGSAHGTFLLSRRRFSTGKDAIAMSIKIAQSNASSASVVRSIEVDSRAFPQPTENPS